MNKDKLHRLPQQETNGRSTRVASSLICLTWCLAN